MATENTGRADPDGGVSGNASIRSLPAFAYNWNGTEWSPQLGGESFIDAFGRNRVSNPETLFSGKSIYDNQPFEFDDAATSGGGTSSTWSQDRASVTLGVSNLTAGTRVRQSKRRPPYQPGKSHRCFITFVFGEAATGITRRAGLFTSKNGIFLEQTATDVAIVIRSNATGTPSDALRVVQADWSENTLLGTDHTLDLTRAQLLAIDFEWLGVGTVRVGFVIEGLVHWVHHFHFANEATGVYMSSPNLPARWEISNSGTGPAATLECICTAIDSEGGLDTVGIERSVDTGITGFTTNNDQAFYPVLGIRLSSTGINGFVRPTRVQIMCTTTAVYRWALMVNPTITGSNLSWIPRPNSPIEYTLPTNAATITGQDYIFASGYGADTQQTIDATGSHIGQYSLGASIDDTADSLVLAVQNITGGVETYHAVLGWREHP